MQIGIDVKLFLERYFQKHDDTLMNKMDQIIGDNENPIEISALADWIFRSYLTEAFTATVEENNLQIASAITKLLKPIYETLNIEFSEPYVIVNEQNEFSEKPEPQKNEAPIIEKEPKIVSAPEAPIRIIADKEEPKKEIKEKPEEDYVYYDSDFDMNKPNYTVLTPKQPLKPFSDVTISQKLIDSGALPANTEEIPELNPAILEKSKTRPLLQPPPPSIYSLDLNIKNNVTHNPPSSIPMNSKKFAFAINETLDENTTELSENSD